MGFRIIKKSITSKLLWVAILLLSNITLAGEVLYNGITLPSAWPPDLRHYTVEPTTAPYLLSMPEVVPIDVGRQLFVDDFLIEQTDLKRTFYRATIHPASPVLVPDKPWEAKQREEGKDPPTAIPFSDGVWYDQKDKIFKMWYMAGFKHATCYATSKDGLFWEKPELDVVEGTNIVKTDSRDSSTVWIDYETKNPNQRYVLMQRVDSSFRHIAHYSADGIHWSEPVAQAGAAWDRSTIFYNPFRKKWVFGLRSGGALIDNGWETAPLQFTMQKPDGFVLVGRTRRYAEGDTLIEAMQSWPHPDDIIKDTDQVESYDKNPLYNTDPVKYEVSVVEAKPFVECMAKAPMWVGCDKLDIRRVPDFASNLYNLDAVAYESLMVGLFTIIREGGGSNNDPAREKINDICVGFSRDGFHWDRPYRKPVIDVSEDPDAWNYSNVQSVGGGFLVVGDKLYIYASGRQVSDLRIRKGVCSTGLAVLRRDGFASMDAGNEEGTLTTRPVRFKGKYLFVNIDAPAGQLSAEVLDSDGQVIEPFTRDNCLPVNGDSTCKQVQWKPAKASNLSKLADKPLRFRFYLTNGNLYSFWVSPDKSGASYGYAAAGGPGFTGPVDTVGSSAGQ